MGRRHVQTGYQRAALASVPAYRTDLDEEVRHKVLTDGAGVPRAQEPAGLLPCSCDIATGFRNSVACKDKHAPEMRICLWFWT